MYCNLSENQLFDDAGAPLSNGRVTVYAKGSDTPVTLYVNSGDDFVPALNPYTTANDGRIPTLFWNAALVDVKVEKNNGNGTYTELDTFVAGIDYAQLEATAGVATISELKSIRPSEGMVVDVNGYYVSGDCPPRKYMWLPNASNTDDGGYVIASLVDSGGRWLMLWEGERLPISLYGVMTGITSQSAKTTNLPNVMALGKSVRVGYIGLNVPATIDFDGRVYGGGSSTAANYYYISNTSLTTEHYISSSKRNVALNNTDPFSVTIHCAGFRGDMFFNAAWIFDQYVWNQNRDPFEKVTTKMFVGNTSSCHDAFMACVACSKVKLVEVSKDGSGTTLYDLITISDDFKCKIVLNYEDDSFPGAIQNVPFYVNVPRGYVSLEKFQVVDNFVLNENAVMELNGSVCVSSENYNDGRTIDFSLRTEPTYKENQVITICNTSSSNTLGLSGLGRYGTGISTMLASSLKMFKAVRISGTLRWFLYD